MDLKGIQLAWITVSNIQEAIKFYTETLGFQLKEFHEEFGWAELSGPEGAILGLGQFNAEFGYKPGSNAVISLTVPDIEKARQELAQKNVHLIDDIMEVKGHVKLQTLKDADGNMFQLCQLLSESE